jgi:hypothetical protein
MRSHRSRREVELAFIFGRARRLAWGSRRLLPAAFPVNLVRMRGQPDGQVVEAGRARAAGQMPADDDKVVIAIIGLRQFRWSVRASHSH